MTMVSFASNIQRSMLFSIFTLLLSNGSNGILVTAFMGSLSNNNNNNNNNRINKERPVKLRIHKQAIQKVKTLIPKEQKNPTSWLLQEYMQLPAAQYACVPLPINGSLERVYGKADEFTLQVPPIRFPISTKAGEVEIIPKVRAIVQVEPDRVTIQSISCSIEGSPAVQEWKLNDRYDLDVCATLTWEKQRHGLLNFMNEEEEEDDGDNGRDSLDDSNEIKSKSTSSSSSSFSPPNELSSSMAESKELPNDATPSSLASSPSSDSTDSLVTLDPTTQDVIRIKTDLAIDVYPPPVKRIKMIPKRLLAKIGNMVMKYVLGLLLEAFLQGLQQDYEKWATDESYRNTRKKLEQELQLELQELAKLEQKKLEQEERQRRQRRRQEERQRRRQRQANNKQDDDSSGGGGGGNGGGPGSGNPFSPFNNLQVGFLQRRRPTATHTAAAATNKPTNLRRGERIIRLIRRNGTSTNNRSVTR
mmetsp:Transcript_31484/g.75961  ORF Transcript_31484/g.75961 Transcript_31484/m.75961 type:complete len:474 (+) Transcript_31484:234-1655(+)